MKTAHPSMSHLTEKDERFKSALMVARRAYETRKRKAGDGGDTSGLKKKFREGGGGRKQQAVEVRQAMFEWFVDIRGSLKARLPVKIFRNKCKEVYETWLRCQNEEVKEEVLFGFFRPLLLFQPYFLAFSRPLLLFQSLLLLCKT